MSSKHTPGPWNWAKSDINGRYSIYRNGPLAYCGDTTAVDGDGEANARLIAAAPDLLVALQSFDDAFSHYCDGDPSPEEWAALKAARAAIAKATGGAA